MGQGWEAFFGNTAESRNNFAQTIKNKNNCPITETLIHANQHPVPDLYGSIKHKNESPLRSLLSKASLYRTFDKKRRDFAVF